MTMENVANSEPFLRIEHLSKRFGSFTAVTDANFDLNVGEIVSLIGPNGSGKTTCINLISGLYPASGGNIYLEGQRIGNHSVHQRVRLGLNRSFQIPKPFKSLTVDENLHVARRYGAPADGQFDMEEIRELLRLDSVRNKRAEFLTNAQQKMLDLGRAIATSPKLVCVDELAAGLSIVEMGWIGGILKNLARRGVSLLVVEHLMDFVRQISDRVVVLDSGRDIFHGSFEDAVRDDRVTEVFFGRKHVRT